MERERRPGVRWVRKKLPHILAVLLGLLLVHEAFVDPYLSSWKTLAASVGLLNVLVHSWFLAARDQS